MEEQYNGLKKQALSSIIWKFLERFIAQGITLVVSIVIARILSPEDYVVVSLVTIFFTFANIIISGGFGTALVQKKDADPIDYSTVLYASLVISIVLYFGLFVSAPYIAAAYKQDMLIVVVRVMGLSLPIYAVKSVVCSYVSSHLQFRRFFFATLGGTLISGVVGIAMALNGFGAWALVAQEITNTMIDTIILMATTKMKLVPSFSFARLKTLFGYGSKILLSSIIATIYTETTPLVIGLRFTSADLSYYTKGRSFPKYASTATTNTLQAVLFPVLSKIQDDKQALLAAVRRYIKMASFVAFPVMLGFFAIADNFVHVVLTDKWMDAVPYIRIFCIAFMFDMVHIGNCEAIKAMGKSGTYLLIEGIKKSLYFVTIIVFLLFSKSPIMLAVSFIVCTLIAMVVNSIPNRKLIGYRYKLQLEDLLPNLIISLAMCLVVYLIGMLNIPPIILLFLQLFSGIVVYVLINLMCKNECMYYCLGIIRELFKHR